MNNISLFCQPGFHCSSDGEMLGLKKFNDTLRKQYSDIDNYAKCDYNEISPEYFTRNAGHFNIGISHSYGGGWSKWALDKTTGFSMDYYIWLDPVKDFWKGQFRLLPWNMPKSVKKGLVIYQTNLPPTGCPFSSDPRIETIDVTNRGLYHCDIPGDVWVSEVMANRLKTFLNTETNSV